MNVAPAGGLNHAMGMRRGVINDALLFAVKSYKHGCVAYIRQGRIHTPGSHKCDPNGGFESCGGVRYICQGRMNAAPTGMLNHAMGMRRGVINDALLFAVKSYKHGCVAYIRQGRIHTPGSHKCDPNGGFESCGGVRYICQGRMNAAPTGMLNHAMGMRRGVINDALLFAVKSYKHGCVAYIRQGRMNAAPTGF